MRKRERVHKGDIKRKRGREREGEGVGERVEKWIVLVAYIVSSPSMAASSKQVSDFFFLIDTQQW